MNPTPTADKIPDGLSGSPDAPALQRRPVAFAISMLLYAAWMAVLIYWAIQLRQSTSA